MGTAAYMAPEQAEGKPLDVRSDIFSFGAVLYELLSGQRAFHGENSVSIMSGDSARRARAAGCACRAASRS